MRRFAVLALIALSAACWPSRQSVPVEVDWTFGGQSCIDAGVASIQIDVEGEVLTPNQFTCVEASQGADLGDFLAGPYVMTVTGSDPAGNVLYQTTQNVQVRAGGKNVVPIDAAPTTGDAAVHWSFDGKTCDAAGTTIGPLSPGAHSFALAATGSSHEYAADGASGTVVAGQVTQVPVNLAVAA